MGDEVEFIYNTRLRRRSLSVDFYSRLSSALMSDFERRNADEEEEAEVDPFSTDGDDVDRDQNYVPEEDASDIDSEVEIEPNEIFDSDEEEEEEGEVPTDAAQQQQQKDGYFYGKDGTKWSKTEPNPVRFRQHNIMRFRGGAKTKNTIPIEVFKLFFSPNISFIIINETNRYANDAVAKWNEAHPDSEQRVWNNLTSTELDAFIGILLAIGLSHNNTQDSRVLWRSDNLPIFRAAMAYKRFIALCRYIRFDDGRTRPFRQQTDKAAPIRDIWNFLNENLAKYYEPYENITVDEQLFPYRGRTKFTQFIPSKPAKYGIKVWWACDSKTKYPLHGKLYTGKDPEASREVNQGENVLLELANRYTNSGRTLVADNFFVTLEGAKRLASLGLALVGTIRSNKRCLPKEMKKDPNRTVLSTLFGFHESLVSLCSYVPKKNKAVNLLSTVHYSKNVEGDALKPEAILFYNANKAGVDCMDQMVTHYSTKLKTNRWTFAFFCNILDVMALASFIICKENGGLTKKDARRKFLDTLSKTLVLANIENRMNNIHVISQFNTRLGIEGFFGRKIDLPSNEVIAQRSGANTLTGKKDCRLCLQGGDKLRRKTRFFCSKCVNPVCQQHSKVDYICFSCTSTNP